MDLLSTGLVLQTFLGALLAINVFYFAEYVTGSSVGAFAGAVLFVAGPPIYANASPYFYYFHPMWVGLALFPFVLAYVHKSLLSNEIGQTSLSPLFVTALFLYHLTVGLMFSIILVLDFIFLLVTFRKKNLVINFSKLVVLTFFISSVLIIPFLSNISNPFKYVYPEGGLQTLYVMFFGVSALAFTSPTGGWQFFSTYLQEFLLRVVPLLVVGLPVMIYLFLKKNTSFTLLLASIAVGLLGIFQPWLGSRFCLSVLSSLYLSLGQPLLVIFFRALP